ASSKIFDQHNIAVELIHSPVEYPPAIRRDSEGHSSHNALFLLNRGYTCDLVGGKVKQFDRGTRNRFVVQETDPMVQQGPVLIHMVKDSAFPSAHNRYPPDTIAFEIVDKLAIV